MSFVSNNAALRIEQKIKEAILLVLSNPQHEVKVSQGNGCFRFTSDPQIVAQVMASDIAKCVKIEIEDVVDIELKEERSVAAERAENAPYRHYSGGTGPG
jgi:hypothetical protein